VFWALVLTLGMIGVSWARTRWHLPDLRLGTIMPTADARRVAGD
jgi:hypothetical protein